MFRAAKGSEDGLCSCGDPLTSKAIKCDGPEKSNINIIGTCGKFNMIPETNHSTMPGKCGCCDGMEQPWYKGEWAPRNECVGSCKSKTTRAPTTPVPTTTQAPANAPVCRARIFQSPGSACDKAPACTGWVGGGNRCCGTIDGACGPSGGANSDFISTDSAKIMGVGSCVGGDFIRVSDGCGIEVYRSDKKTSMTHRGDAILTKNSGLGWNVVRFIRLFRIRPLATTTKAAGTTADTTTAATPPPPPACAHPKDRKCVDGGRFDNDCCAGAGQASCVSGYVHGAECMGAGCEDIRPNFRHIVERMGAWLHGCMVACSVSIADLPL